MKIAFVATSATSLAALFSPSHSFVTPASKVLLALKSTALKSVVTDEDIDTIQSDSEDRTATHPPQYVRGKKSKITPERITKVTQTRPYPLFLAEKAASVLDFAAAKHTPPTNAKEHFIVLGTGWGAATFLKNIDTDKFEVTVISPRNYFVFTPMLAGASVGTVDFKSITEPIREVCSMFIQ